VKINVIEQRLNACSSQSVLFQARNSFKNINFFRCELDSVWC